MPHSHPEAALRIFGAPLRYIQGPGVLQHIGPTLAGLGQRALLVADALVLDKISPTLCASGQAGRTRWG